MAKPQRLQFVKLPRVLVRSLCWRGQYMPDAFSPSNFLWGDMLLADGIELTTIAEVTAPNTAGIIVKKVENRFDHHRWQT